VSKTQKLLKGASPGVLKLPKKTKNACPNKIKIILKYINSKTVL